MKRSNAHHLQNFMDLAVFAGSFQWDDCLEINILKFSDAVCVFSLNTSGILHEIIVFLIVNTNTFITFAGSLNTFVVLFNIVIVSPYLPEFLLVMNLKMKIKQISLFISTKYCVEIVKCMKNYFVKMWKKNNNLIILLKCNLLYLMI